MDFKRGSMRKKVLVRAPALSRTGYGEHARFVLRSLRKHEDKFDIFLDNTNWGQSGWIFRDNEERRWIDTIIAKTMFHVNNDGGPMDVSVQVTIPNEWQPLAPVNIGVTAGIETTQVAPQWVEQSFVVDKIITTSNHSKQVYENTTYEAQHKETMAVIKEFRCERPIEVVHYPVKDIEKAEIDCELETDFNFLVVAQWGPRKNIENTVRWFIEEFVDNSNVGMVLKLFYRNGSIIDRVNLEENVKNLLNEYPQRKCKIYLLHGDMSEEEMTGLYTHPKIKTLVSLTHGEGYGLPLFEAAYNALPVLAPDWSGHVDFLFKPTKDKKGKIKQKAHFAKVDYDIGPVSQEVLWPGVLENYMMWCYPKQGSYKMKLREIHKDHGRFKSQAKKLQKWIRKEFSEDKQYEKMANAILSVIEKDETAEEKAVVSYE